MWLWIQTPMVAMATSDVVVISAWRICQHGKAFCMGGFAYVALQSTW